ncbi:rhodanese-like domain-containing protein [Robiginitalea sp.]|uniref:rhodanese-like domain-containing protein n=1 Tax=Robiginitalea sp. TaxID=1902411 RepID=UPI003C71D52A
MKKTLSLFVLVLLLFSCAEKRQMPITEFSNDALGPKDLLVDVRTPGEFAEGHFEDALNIDWMSEDFLKSWDTIPKGGRVYLYCKKGGRSAMAAHVLDSLGYQVVDLTGGWDEYTAQKQ